MPQERLCGGIDALCARARRLCAGGGRRVLGITGAPGAGKSTIAADMVRALAPDAVLVPMDGFHLANSELERLGKRDRKGAIDTFDGAGYVALIERLKAAGDEIVFAPEFRRDIEEAIAGAIAVPPRVPLVVTEGNYLLSSERPWSRLRALIDEFWFVDPGEEIRLERLIARHVAFGKSTDAARAWALGTDQRNAQTIAATRDAADFLIDDL